MSLISSATSKVVEMRPRGLSQTEIAHELQVSEASISSDIQYLRNQAKESIKEYVTEVGMSYFVGCHNQTCI
jgi:transcriptional regulator